MKLPPTPRKTTPAFGFAYIDRALSDCFARRQFKRKEQKQVLDYFEQWEHQPACAFCGDPEVKGWDHIVPVSGGGETVLGNMVLACGSYDDSKGKQPFDVWMTSNASKSPESRGVPDIGLRIRRINDYVNNFGYIPRTVLERLNRTERRRRQHIGSQLKDLRQEVDSLIDDYQKRDEENSRRSTK